jgi:hypothetical protein
VGRPSVLTEPMKADIQKQLAEGTPIREVARRYKVGEATLRRNFSTQIPIVRDVAQRLSSAEIDLARLPISAQRAARTLADQLKSIQDSVASAAANGADTGDRLHALANRKARQLDEESTEDDLRPIVALTASANEALKPALALVAANKPKAETTEGGLEKLLTESWGNK